MFKLYTVTKNELLRYFSSSLAYVYLLTFLFLNASMTLYLGNFIERGTASLAQMFSFLPWIYLIFISGIAMRLWAEEFKTKTIIQILSSPVSTTQLVWGKFIAAWLFCSLGLLLTFPFVVTVNWLGVPDNGVIIFCYLACFLLSGAMIAVAQAMSTFTKNQVIALVLSVIVNLLFFLSGIEYVLRFFRSFLPYNLIETIASLSFLSHYDDICSGFIGLHNIFFFISIIVLFNFITEVIVRFKTSGVLPFFKAKSYYSFVLLFFAAWLGFAGFNMLNNYFFNSYTIDITKDKIYTLPQAAQDILSHIQEPITVKVYYSPVLSQRNPLFRRALNHLHKLLKNYKKYAQNKLNYRLYYPQFLNKAEDMAIHDNMTPIPLPDLNQSAFFGVSLVDEAGRSLSIPLLPLENLDKFEQEIIQNIYTFSHSKPTLGILSSIPLFGLSITEHSVGTQWQIINEIEKLYHIKSIEKTDDLNSIDVLLIIHPQDMSQELVHALEKYTLNGGKILILADIATEAQRLYSPINQRLSPTDLGGLEKIWGFQYHPQTVIADLDNSITVNVGNKDHASYAQDVIEFYLSGKNINTQALETKYLSQLLFASATPITPIEGHPSIFIPLISTSQNSALLSSEVVYNNTNPATILAQFKSDDTAKIVAAKIVSQDKSHPFEVIVIGDSDFAYDDFWSQFHLLEEHKYLVFLNDNANFILNALDSLSGHTALIPLRQSHTYIPKFESWEVLRKQNALDVAVKEREIFKKIEQTKIQLNDLWQKRNFEGRQDFSDDELAQIAQFRTSLQAFKQDLSDLRIKQDNNISHQKKLIVFYNLYAIPLLIIFGLLIFVIVTRKKAKYTKASSTLFNYPFLIVFSSCALLFVIGISTILSSSNVGQEFENQLVFPDWKEQLNNIYKITLKQNDSSLIFYKKDGIWYAQGYEKYPLYQRRIINFLATLANARYLERKSARAEYLPKFGLDHKHATSITLNDDKNHTLLQFEIGKYDEEIGRGGRGAFLKFTNRFQAWLIEADFISLSTNWRDWTLNTALNPRFGRILQTDKNFDTDVLLLLLKELYNTPLTLAPETINKPPLLEQITLTFENKDSLTLYFEQLDDTYYVRYQFGKIEGDYLRLFATYAAGKRYQIPTENMEKIKDVFTSLGQSNQR